MWAVLPVTFVIIALAFSGVYTHQRDMRDFVAVRDLALARLTARMVEEGLVHGVVSPDGSHLATWLPSAVTGQPGTVWVVGGDGQVLARSGPELAGDAILATPDGIAALQQGEGTVIVSSAQGPLLVAAEPVAGTDWVVVVIEPVEALVGSILRLPSLTPLVAAGAGLVSLLILTFGWLTIIRPLQRLARAAGQVSWGDFSAISRPVGGVQEVRDLHQALADMAERVRSYEAGVRDYVSAVTQGQEAERARLARDLHDGPVQELIALGQRAEMAQRMAERGERERVRTLLDELRRAELDAVDQLRHLINDLRPPYLEDLGFMPALEMLVQQAAQRTSVRIRLETQGAARRCAPDVELVAYRIAQEALNNALQHADAQEIAICVRYDAQEMSLSVADDGKGFSLPQRPDQLTQAGHFGLVGMRERATLLGGDLDIRTAPGQGTRILFRLPTKSTTKLA
jgi:signal transduction histidine kinase